MDKLLFKRILVAALTILALIYVTYLLISANFDMYPTENAVQTTITHTINTNGFIIRDETIISNNTNGVLSYSYSNGEAVNANAEIAKVYSSEQDAVAQTQADKLQARINTLKESQNGSITGALSIDVLNNLIQGNIINFLYNANQYDIDSVKTDADSLLASINQRQVFTGKVKNFDSQIAELQTQVDSLRASSGKSIGTVTTPKAGYFTEFCDGYENIISYNNLDDLTLDSFKKLAPKKIAENTAGKVVCNINWYVACAVSADDAASLSIWDGSVTVKFSEASTEAIPASVYRIQRPKEENGQALVILQCDYMDRGLLEARQEPIEIGMGTFSGLRVSKRAIHDDYVTKVTYDENDKAHKEKKKVQGVYVLYGSEIQFKQISILYADKDYVICNPSPDEGILFNGETISLYDKIIVKGDDLFDGKVIK